MKVLRFKVGRVPCITRWWYECHSFDPLIIAVVPGWWLPYCWRWWMLKTEDCCETSRPFSWQRLGMGLILICFWEIIFYFFMYQWGSPTLGGVLVKLSRWEFQLPLTPASSCGGCFVWYRWRHTYGPTYSTQRGVLQLWAFRLQFTYGPEWQLALANSHEGSHGSNGVWIVVVV